VAAGAVQASPRPQRPSARRACVRANMPAATGAALVPGSVATGAVDGNDDDDDRSPNHWHGVGEDGSAHDPYMEDGSDPNADLLGSLPSSVSFTRVRSASYVSSCVDVANCPPPRHPEFAVIGRSNVGKSSLINCLTNVKGLAHVSKEPGG
jgi:hypothetical protein